MKNGFTLVECILETGRTHQIRVHMQYIKYPIVGDPLYYLNRRYDFLPGQLLHATELSFIHPTSSEKVVCTCDLPDHFKEVLNSLRTNGTLK